jgi:hypothetical protein
VRVFKTTTFAKFARKVRLDDEVLFRAALDAQRGLIGADLGGGVIKQRIGRAGGGKSGGFRTLIAFRSGDRAIYVYGFAKNERDNISEEELRVFKKLAVELLALGTAEMAVAVSKGVLMEIFADG